jgi:hypothetical protein
MSKNRNLSGKDKKKPPVNLFPAPAIIIETADQQAIA